MIKKPSGVKAILASCFFVLSLVAAQPVLPATIIVDTTADDNVVNGNCTIREAIRAANLNLGVDNCAAGDDNNDLIDLAGISGIATLASALPDISRNVTIMGPGSGTLTINANGTGRIFTINSSGLYQAVGISGLTMTGGNDANSGGAIFVSLLDTLNLSASVITNNQAPNGGGIYNEGGTVVVDGCSLSDNLAQHYGGAIYNQSNTITITNSVIQDNTASDSYGGGMLSDGTAYITNSTIAGNTAAWGGGVCMRTGSTTITGTEIYANTASNGCGGGIYTQDGTLTISQSAISANMAGLPGTGWSGGGIFANTNFTLTKSAVYGNQGGSGGGIVVQGNGLIVNSTISSNASTFGPLHGAGIQNTACDACTITITNSTIADNAGIGFSNDRYATLKNVILANNSAGNCFGTITSQGHNLDSGSTCGFGSTGDLFNADPLIGPLQDNGGSTMTHALLKGSPAIDAGDNAGCPVTDQRGFQRPQDGDKDGSALCDIGAYEALTKVTIVSPNGGEVLHPYQDWILIWGAPSTAKSYKLFYTLNQGTTWVPITTGFITGTSMPWIVPGLTKNKTKCLIKVAGFDDKGKKVGVDKSDEPFAIGVLTITDINGGNNCTSGLTCPITWTLADTITPEQLQVSYTLDGGATWKKEPPIPMPPGSTYDWTAPNVNKDKTCKLKLTLKTAEAKVATATSGKFTINKP